jgi:hypothetical protein
MNETSDSPMYRLIVGWSEVIHKWKETFPPEAWAHFREIDGRWEIIEKGVTPHGWRELSMASPLFHVQFEEPFIHGDRMVVSEEIYVYEEGGVLRPLHSPEGLS